MTKGDVAPSTIRSWRTSRALVFFTATLGLFTENFLYGFVVPILPYMIEARLGLDPIFTQRYTAQLLFIMGLISVPAAPIIGHFADKTASRKIPLLISLLGCTIGTLLVAFTPSMWLVFVGRTLQGIAGTGAWIVGFAMLTDAAGKKDMGKALGVAGSFITAGMIMGPAVAGALLQWLGYWPAWSVPLALLAIDFIARLAMVEEPKPSKPDSQEPDSTTTPRTEPQAEAQSESCPLLTPTTPKTEIPSPNTSALHFYRIFLSKLTVWAALFNICVFSLLISGFDATLPIHLRSAFNWGPAPTGSIFLGFQIPAVIVGPVVGYLRDRVGLRWPTTIGWACTAPLLWFCGVPGPDNFLGIGAGTTGQAAFVASIIAIGFALCFTRGAGTFQLITILHELREHDPDVFGPGGGSSRIFSLSEMSFAVGLMLGPVVCGSLADAFGFYYTTCALAAVTAGVATSSFLFFTHKSPVREPETEE